MLRLLQSLRPFFFRKKQESHTDNGVFRLHYRTTVGFLLLGALLVGFYELCCLYYLHWIYFQTSSYHYVDSSDSSIQCMLGSGPATPLVSHYCWLASTYTLPRLMEDETTTRKYQEESRTYPGVGPVEEGEERRYHAYYQWVPLYLLFLAVLLYAPHLLWKVGYPLVGVIYHCLQECGGGRLTLILGTQSVREEKTTKDVEVPEDIEDEDWSLVEGIASYFTERVKLGLGGCVTERCGLLICEFVNLAVVMIAIFLTDSFLGGDFRQFGLDALAWLAREEEERVDPLTKVFPKMSKCDFRMFGPSGTIQTVDALCVLGINALNEKIFVFIWFWLHLLALISALQVLLQYDISILIILLQVTFRLLLLLLPSLRLRVLLLQLRLHREDRDQGLEKALCILSHHLTYSDWWLVTSLRKTLARTSGSQELGAEEVGRRKWLGLVHLLAEKVETLEEPIQEEVKLLHFIQKLSNMANV